MILPFPMANFHFYVFFIFLLAHLRPLVTCLSGVPGPQAVVSISLGMRLSGVTYEDELSLWTEHSHQNMIIKLFQLYLRL